MKQVEMVAPKRLLVKDVPVPTPGPGEVALAVAYVGVCGSDVHAYLGEHPFIDCPVVPGHEFSGTIKALGQGVTGWKLGQRVTVEPSLACGQCRQCREGRYNICQNLQVLGCQATGALGEVLVVPAERLVPLPDGMTLEQGALVEPAAVAVGIVRQGGSVGGKRVVVLGAGTIGLMTMQVAKAHGAAAVLQSDVVPKRLALAAELGADHVANVAETDLSTAIEAAFGPDGANVIYECVGIEATIASAIRVARKGSRVVVGGVYGHKVCVDMAYVQDRELELVGSLMYRRPDFVEAVRLVASGQVRGLPLVTHRYELAQAAEAFEMALAGGEASLKVLVRVAGGR